MTENKGINESNGLSIIELVCNLLNFTLGCLRYAAYYKLLALVAFFHVSFLFLLIFLNYVLGHIFIELSERIFKLDLLKKKVSIFFLSVTFSPQEEILLCK